MGSTEYRFSSHVKTCVDYHRTTRQPIKLLEKLVINGIGLPMYRLHPGGIVYVSNSGNVRARDIELLYAKQPILVFCHENPPPLPQGRTRSMYGESWSRSKYSLTCSRSTVGAKG